MSALQASRPAYHQALLEAIADLQRAQTRLEGLKGAVREQDALVGKLGDLVLRLNEVAGPLEDCAAAAVEVVRNLIAAEAGDVPRGGEIFTNVVRLFDKMPHREWSTMSIQAELADAGQDADPKALHNVLGYLARKGRLVRVGRGQYRDVGSGAGFVVDPGFDDEHSQGGCMNE